MLARIIHSKSLHHAFEGSYSGLALLLFLNSFSLMVMGVLSFLGLDALYFRVYYITSRHESHLSNLFILLYPLIPLTLFYAFYSAPTLPSPTGGYLFVINCFLTSKCCIIGLRYHRLRVWISRSVHIAFPIEYLSLGHSFSIARVYLLSIPIPYPIYRSNLIG